ncbi:hypothetical protein FORC065_1259 [Yersinia enterocolitica]|nr:hypothetical protein FORC065_1259 [Yersinia enterocolitica]
MSWVRDGSQQPCILKDDGHKIVAGSVSLSAML